MGETIRSLVVCVNYDDLLAVTLPRNIIHVSQTLVITDSKDHKTHKLVESFQQNYPGKVKLYITDSFYKNGAYFNKGLAIEEALDYYDRSGWLLIWDADIVFPERMPLPQLSVGNLYSPYRRILRDTKRYSCTLPWYTLPLGKDGNDFNGYYQLFNATDPVLANHPWYDTSWNHAGGCDFVFQSKWKKFHKKRLTSFEVLHLGPVESNWIGRVSPRLDNEPIENRDKLLASIPHVVADYHSHRKRILKKNRSRQ